MRGVLDKEMNARVKGEKQEYLFLYILVQKRKEEISTELVTVAHS